MNRLHVKEDMGVQITGQGSAFSAHATLFLARESGKSSVSAFNVLYILDRYLGTYS